MKGWMVTYSSFYLVPAVFPSKAKASVAAKRMKKYVTDPKSVKVMYFTARVK